MVPTLVKQLLCLESGKTRFIKGVYQISNDDVLQGKKFDDSIAMSAQPIINFYGYRRFLEHNRL